MYHSEIRQVQKIAPRWDGRSERPLPGDADAAERAVKYLMAAAVGLPHDWSLQMFIGKL